MVKQITIQPLGDAALIVNFGEGISPTLHKKVQNLKYALEKNPFKGFIEAVPAYNTITVYYQPFIVYKSYPEKENTTSFQKVSLFIQKIISDLNHEVTLEESIIKIPVLYGGEWGPDLAEVAYVNHLTPKEVIRYHTEKDYLVYMLGFAPGFPFLGGMDLRIKAPRKESPRLKIPAGSVGIAGEQTGIYSLETPGGWQIIGRTPLDLFLPEQTPPTLLQPGNKVRFVPISAAVYRLLKEEKRCLLKSFIQD